MVWQVSPEAVPEAGPEAGLDALVCLSLSVRDGDEASLRERATLTPDEFAAAFGPWLTLQRERGLPDASVMFLSTCHRVELYAWGAPTDELLSFWLGARQVPYAPTRIKRGLHAFRHLVRVTASLESEVLGETQITGQVRDAAETARRQGHLRGPLDRCLQHALRCAKRIRSESSLGQGTVSVAHVAVDGLVDVFDTLEDKHVLVVGAGPMAVQALERVLERRPAGVSWVNRSALKLAQHPLVQREAGRVRVEDFSRLPELLWNHEVSVLATASPAPLVTRSELERARNSARVFAAGGGVVAGASAGRAPDLRVVLDLGLPRNVEARVHGYAGFLLRNVDEFRDRAARNSQRRRDAMVQAERVFEEDSANFLKIWEAWEKGPLLAELFRGLDHIVGDLLSDLPKRAANDLTESELSDLASRASPTLSVEVAREVEYMVRNIYAKMMHRVVEEVEALEAPLAHQVLETLVRAWRQPDQWPQRNPSQLQKVAKPRRPDPTGK